VRNDAAKTPANAGALAQLGLRTRAEEQAGASLSGHERDHLFLSDRGVAFADVGGVSGLDDPADGRAAAFLDYDRDGWLDIALTNANAPRLVLFRNRIGCLPPAAGGRIVALRFVGGNATPRPAPGWSARDGIGARVTVDLGDVTLVREQRAGEGFAAQNSATMVIGIGARTVVPALTLAWPAGKSATTADIPAGTLLTVYENPAQSPTGEVFVREAYARPVASRLPAAPGAPAPAGAVPATAAPTAAAARSARRVTLPPPPGETPPRLRLYSTMATWCVACRGELAQLRGLRDLFSPADLAMAGVPIDTTESADQVKAWGAANRPPYELLANLTRVQVLGVKSVVRKELNSDAVPATLITDAAGNLLHAQWGPPTLSRIRVLLAGLARSGPATTTPAATAPPACGE